MARDPVLKFLLDTNIISELRKRESAHRNVIAWVQQTSSADMGTSVVVLAEIRRGIALKRRSDPAQADALDRWYMQMRLGLGDRVIDIDEAIADQWALMSVPDPCLLYTSPSPRDRQKSRMPSSA